MHAKKIPFVLAVSLLLPRTALADPPSQWKLETAFHVSYLIAGGSTIAGGAAPRTGGVALVPTGRLLYALRYADPYLAGSPILVTPYSADRIGFVGAFDLGASWHPDTRAWAIGTGLTLAPSYMRFCNAAPWCLREGLLMYGGEVHAAGRVWEQVDGGGLHITVDARLLTGRPTAWYWSRLTPEEAAVNHYSMIASAGVLWRF